MIIVFGFQEGVGRRTCGEFLTTQLRIKHPGLVIKHIRFDTIIKQWAHEIFGLRRPIYYENHPEEAHSSSGPKLCPIDVWFELERKLKEIDPNVLINKIRRVKADIKIISDAIEPIDGAININITNSKVPSTCCFPNDFHIKNDGTLKNLMFEIGGLADAIQTQT